MIFDYLRPNDFEESRGWVKGCQLLLKLFFRIAEWFPTTRPTADQIRGSKRSIEFKVNLGQDRSMATLSLTDEQVVQLVKQLPLQSKQRVLTDLTAERDQWWQASAGDGEKDMRRLASAHGLDWNTMTEAQREKFVDDLLHET
jgi:hypothetical protein